MILNISVVSIQCKELDRIYWLLNKGILGVPSTPIRKDGSGTEGMRSLWVACSYMGTYQIAWCKSCLRALDKNHHASNFKLRDY